MKQVAEHEASQGNVVENKFIPKAYLLVTINKDNKHKEHVKTPQCMFLIMAILEIAKQALK